MDRILEGCRFSQKNGLLDEVQHGLEREIEK